jgi:predicted DNA-binding transcriptional regulator AlpA
MSTQVQQQALSINDFCRAYGISRALFYTMAKAGTAPESVKCGRRVLIPVAAAQTWLEQRKAGKQAAAA